MTTRSEGGIGVLRESVEIALGASHLGRLDTIIDPIVISELPTVLWSPHSRDEAVEALLPIVDVILIDTDDPVYFDGPGAALARAADLLDSNVDVVDLAWLRTIAWRERLAGSFSDPSRARGCSTASGASTSATTTARSSRRCCSPAGWRRASAGSRARSSQAAGGARQRGPPHVASGGPSISIEFNPVEQSIRGLAGVTVTGSSGFSLSLERAPGGLIAREQQRRLETARMAAVWRLAG